MGWLGAIDEGARRLDGDGDEGVGMVGRWRGEAMNLSLPLDEPFGGQGVDREDGVGVWGTEEAPGVLVPCVGMSTHQGSFRLLHREHGLDREGAGEGVVGVTNVVSHGLVGAGGAFGGQDLVEIGAIRVGEEELEYGDGGVVVDDGGHGVGQGARVSGIKEGTLDGDLRQLGAGGTKTGRRCS